MQGIISTQLNNMPEFLTSNDLVSLGLFRDPDAAYIARRHGWSPDYVKIGRKIFYPKLRVIEFISSRLKNGAESQS